VNESVSKHLEQVHGLRIAPGHKGICPFCRHDTFSVKPDDTLGKCFHSSCGKYITAGSLREEYRGSLYEILDVLRQKSHEHLVGNPKGYAYHYLTEPRQVHPDVVRDLADLGAIPTNMTAAHVANLFQPALDEIEGRRKELEDKIEKSQNRRLEAKEERQEAHRQGQQKTKPGARSKTEDERRWEKEIDDLGHRRDWLEEQLRALSERLPQVAGWLAFFHADAHHRVRSIRFRKPSTMEKKFQAYKPFKAKDESSETGLFGHSLFRPYQGEDKQGCNRLMLVEGEINLLQIHSLAVRTAEPEPEGAPPGPRAYANWVGAVGSANTLDTGTIAALLRTPGAARFPVVIQDHDDAGDAMVCRLSKSFTLEVVVPPAPGQDVDEFILSFAPDWPRAWRELHELIQARAVVHRPYEVLARLIYRLRQYHGEDDHRREFEIHKAARDIIVKDLTDRGQFYQEHQQGYYFLAGAKVLVALDDSDKQLSCLLERYGLNPAERIHEYLREALHLEALQRGLLTRVHRLAWFNRETFTLYVFNHAEGIYRITADSIELVDNGTDGVLFLRDRRNEPFRLVAEEDLGDLFREHVSGPVNFDGGGDGRLTADDQARLLDLWFLSTFFGSLLPTRPILAFIGPKGSGKSYTLRRIGKILFGNFEVKKIPPTEGDFDAITSNCHYAAFDNADTNVAWLPDRLATCATGGTVSKRVLYTTNTSVDYPVNCFLGITSRTPHFRRDDVADRLLVCRVKRFEGEGFVAEAALDARTLRQRDRIMTSVVRRLQECIAALKQTEGRQYHCRFRMADFGTFALRLADARGERQAAEDLLDRLAADQSAFALDANTLPDLLLRWLEEPTNRGRAVTAAELHKDLARIAERDRVEFDCKSGKSLAQYLTNMEPSLRAIVAMGSRPDTYRRCKVYWFEPLEADREAPGAESSGIDGEIDSGNSTF
jgi:hypothetical protein